MCYAGEYFEAGSSASCRAWLSVEENAFVIRADGQCLARGLELESLQDSRSMHFRCGRQFLADELFEPDFIRTHAGRAAHFLQWLEVFTPARVVGLALLFLMSLVLFRFGFHHVSDAVAAVFPRAWEQQIGSSSYQTLQDLVFKPSRLPVQQQQRLREQALQLAQLGQLEYTPEIVFHHAETIGPNAMAFPGGPIVVTDQLVNWLESEEQVLAVMAHELMHLRQRHSIRQIINVAGASVVAMMVFAGDQTSLNELSGVAIGIWGFSNSRRHEREADTLAIALLQDAGYDGTAFVAAIRRLTDVPGCTTSREQVDCEPGVELPGWLSTHPAGAERLQYLQAMIAPARISR